MSTVHGAFASGVREARNILKGTSGDNDEPGEGEGKESEGESGGD
jgi:hypothetical protein